MVKWALATKWKWNKNRGGGGNPDPDENEDPNSLELELKDWWTTGQDQPQQQEILSRAPPIRPQIQPSSSSSLSTPYGGMFSTNLGGITGQKKRFPIPSKNF